MRATTVPIEPVPAEALSPERAWRFLLLALVLIGGTVRILYFLQLQSGALLHLDLWDGCDMWLYRTWADQIAAGDWLSRDVAPPEHVIADAYLSRHPDDPAWALAGGNAAQAGIVLWDRWFGQGQFYVDPLYPYLLAALELITGQMVLAALLTQLVAGVGIVVLVATVTRDAFGRVAGAFAGLATLAYAPLLTYELVLVRETFLILLCFALLWTLQRTQLTVVGTAIWGLAGVLTGLAILMKSSLVFVWLAGAVLLAFDRHPERLRRFAAYAFGSAALVGLLVARNLAVGVPAFANGSSGPLAFAIANASEATPYAVAFNEAVSILAPDRNLGRVVKDTLATHADLGSFAALLYAKVLAITNDHEIPDNISFYYFRAQAPILRTLPLTLGWIAPFAVIGLAVGWRRGRVALPVYFLLACNFAMGVAFFVYSRHRLPMVATLLPFVGLGASTLLAAARARQWKGLAAMAASSVLVLAWVWRPHHPEGSEIRLADYQPIFSAYYEPRFREAVGAADDARVFELLSEATSVLPPNVTEALEGGPVTASAREAAAFYRPVVENLALAAELTGHPEQAKQAKETSQALAALAGGAP